jgi:hypothetical protein
MLLLLLLRHAPWQSHGGCGYLVPLVPHEQVATRRRERRDPDASPPACRCSRCVAAASSDRVGGGVVIAARARERQGLGSGKQGLLQLLLLLMKKRRVVRVGRTRRMRRHKGAALLPPTSPVSVVTPRGPVFRASGRIRGERREAGAAA